MVTNTSLTAFIVLSLINKRNFQSSFPRLWSSYAGVVAWCVKERESVNLFHCFRVVFYRLSRLVRAWPASQARASFSRRLKRAFV